MKMLVTGAAGFLGSRLARTLLAGVQDPGGVSRVVAADTAPCPIDDPRLESRVGTITDADFVASLIDQDTAVVFHLAAVVSGEAEADLDLGMRVNIDGTRCLLETCRRRGHAPRFVFSSTCGVFGGPLPDVVPEHMALWPQSSYGAQKAIAEHLVCDYARRGLIDGVACRLPTIAVRPGAPNAALSSFVSGIIREPLAGIDAVCPVPLDTPVWISSPDTVIANLVHAARLDTATLETRRIVNLPGLRVTPAEMLDSLERLAGAAARARVRCEVDASMMRIVCSWPGAFDITRALALGFRVDPDIDAVIRQFMTESRDVLARPSR